MQLDEVVKLNELCGKIYVYKDGIHLLAHTGKEHYQFISLSNGNRYSDISVTLADIEGLTDVTHLFELKQDVLKNEEFVEDDNHFIHTETGMKYVAEEALGCDGCAFNEDEDGGCLMPINKSGEDLRVCSSFSRSVVWKEMK